MSERRWVLVSVCLNVILAVLWIAREERGGVAPALTQPARSVAQPAPFEPHGDSDEGLRRREILRVEPLAWANIQSPDLAQYAGNLRNARCPEATVYIIVFDELCRLYLPKVSAIVDEVRDRYYETVAEARGNITDLAKPQQEKLEKLAEEMEQTLETALGRTSWPISNEGDRVASCARLSDILSAEQASAVVEIWERYATEREQARRAPEGGKDGLLAAIGQREENDLRTIVNEAQFQDLQLRRLPESSVIAERSDFEATPPEWKKILEIRRKNQDAAAQEAAIEDLLGPERASEFEANARQEFREFAVVAGEAGLPNSIASQGWALRQQLEAERARIAAGSMPQAVKNSLLDTWSEMARSSLIQLMGHGPAEAYIHAYGRQWLE